MKIQFLGHASFLLTTNAGTTIVTDPFDPEAYKESLKYERFYEPVDIVTVSHDHGDHSGAQAIVGNPIIIKGNGKFVAKEVEFLGVATFHDDERGAKRGKNTVFVISVDGLRIAHMGDLGHVLTGDQAAEIGAVDVALVPVGGFYTIDAAQAHKVAEQISANIIIPMHYRNEKCDFPIVGVEDFIRGEQNVERKRGSTFDLVAGKLPCEPRIVVLEPTL